MKTATEIAVEVRAAKSLEDAAFLIQRFADREANAAAVRAIQHTGRTLTDTLGVLFGSPLAPLNRKESTDA